MKINKSILAVLCVSILTLSSLIAVTEVLAINPAIPLETINQTLGAPTYGNWTYGSGSSCYSYDLAMAADGGYLIAGKLETYVPTWSWDAWLIKVDSAGIQQWNKSYGYPRAEAAYSIINCSDGGYAFTGYTTSFSTDTAMWLVKIDENGTEQWFRTFGETGRRYGLNLIETSDGGFLIVGYIDQFSNGNFDYYIVKTNSMGYYMWDKTFGYSGIDAAYGAVETADKCYVIAGSTNTSQSGFKGWLIKVDSNGNQIWNRTYTGPMPGSFRRIVKTSNGFTMVGSTDVLDEDRIWLVNVDENGTVIWSQIYGDNTTYCPVLDLIMTQDEGYALTGYTYSSEAFCDLFLIKADKTGKMAWNQTFGGSRYDDGWAILQTSYGYALAGSSESYNNLTRSQYWLVLMDSNGRINYNLTTHTIGQGTISSGNQTFISGTKVNLAAVPADGWVFSGWTGAATGTTNTTITMDNDKTVTATFNQTPYNLTIITVGSGSVYPGNQSYNRGTNVSLSATNAGGWSFSGWSGDVTGSSNTTIIMSTNKIVTATFTQDSTPTPTPTATTTPSPTSSSSPVSTPTSTPASTSQASPSPSMSASRSPTPSPPTVTQNPAPSVPELSSIILVPAILSAIIAMVIKRSQRK